MRFGLVLPSTVASVRTCAPLVEELGFDYLACGEHVLSAGECHNALVTLAHAAALTERIGLLTSVTIAPLYPPALLAKMTAVLDVLSGGRLHVGVGAGGDVPAEFDACGVPLSGRGRRVDEAVGVMRALWAGGSMAPSPVRPPPVWIGGRSEAAMRRAARLGDVWLPYLMTPDRFRRSRERVAELSDGAGPAAYVQVALAVSRDADAARRTGEAAMRATYGDAAVRYLVAGTPDECRGALDAYADAGADGAIVSLACPDDDWPAMATTLAAVLAL